MPLLRLLRLSAVSIYLWTTVTYTAGAQEIHKSDTNGAWVGLRLHKDNEFASFRFSALNNSFTTIATPLYFFVGGNGMNVAKFYDTNSNVAFKIGGGSWGMLSDIRLKKDIRDFKVGSQELLSVRPRTFKYNGASPLAPDNGRTYVGVVAQEVRQSLPFTVEPVEETLDGEPILGFDSSALVYVLVNAVQDQAKELRELHAKAQALKAITCGDYPNAKVCQ